MRCVEVRENLVAYLDGELSPEERERVESHLTSCSTCLRERAAFESTGDLLRLLGPEPKSGVDLAGRILDTARSGDPWCRHIGRNLVAHADGELTETDGRPVVEHLGECEDCTRERRDLLRTGEALALWRIPVFDVDLVSRLGIASGRGRSRILGWVSLAAAASVLVAAALSQLLSRTDRYSEFKDDPDLTELAADLDWLESIPDLELAMLNGRGGS